MNECFMEKPAILHSKYSPCAAHLFHRSMHYKCSNAIYEKKITISDYMKVLLTCSQCDFTEYGSSEKELINKMVMWNHLKSEHPSMAERIMRMYKTAPNNIFGVQPA